MNIQPCLEELEERSVPTTADLLLFQQQQLPILEAQFRAFVPIMQTNLQTNLNNLEALAPLFPATSQPLLGAWFSVEQRFVKAFPDVAKIWFRQMVANLEMQLLAKPANPPVQPVVFAPGFFGPGFLGFPGVLPVGGGGVAVTTGFTGGTGGSSGGSGSGGGFAPNMAGRGMGAGLHSTVGALTLPPSNHP